MKKISFFHFLKLSIIILLTYNIFTISILYFPSNNVKSFLWGWTPYNYKKILYYPINIRKLSMFKKESRLLALTFLNKNEYKDYLEIDFWNYKLIIESIDRDNIKKSEKSFYKALILSKNNPDINLKLREYFIQNYSRFSSDYKKKILINFFN